MRMRILLREVSEGDANLIGKLIEQHLDCRRRDLAAWTLKVAVLQYGNARVLGTLDVVGRLHWQGKTYGMRIAIHCFDLHRKAQLSASNSGCRNRGRDLFMHGIIECIRHELSGRRGGGDCACGR